MPNTNPSHTRKLHAQIIAHSCGDRSSAHNEHYTVTALALTFHIVCVVVNRGRRRIVRAIPDTTIWAQPYCDETARHSSSTPTIIWKPATTIHTRQEQQRHVRIYAIKLIHNVLTVHTCVYLARIRSPCTEDKFIIACLIDIAVMRLRNPTSCH